MCVVFLVKSRCRFISFASMASMASLEPRILEPAPSLSSGSPACTISKVCNGRCCEFAVKLGNGPSISEDREAAGLQARESNDRPSQAFDEQDCLRRS